MPPRTARGGLSLLGWLQHSMGSLLDGMGWLSRFCSCLANSPPCFSSLCHCAYVPHRPPGYRSRPQTPLLPLVASTAVWESTPNCLKSLLLFCHCPYSVPWGSFSLTVVQSKPSPGAEVQGPHSRPPHTLLTLPPLQPACLLVVLHARTTPLLGLTLLPPPPAEPTFP